MGLDRKRPPLRTRIENEIAAGRLWRAKEIIRGTIGHTWPDSDVIEQYGQILLRMGDDVEAGKYLWLSGVRRAEYERAVALFLRRHARHGRQMLVAQIPKSFRRVPFSQLPAELRDQLTDYGVRSSDFGSRRQSSQENLATGRWKEALLAASESALSCVSSSGPLSAFTRLSGG